MLTWVPSNLDLAFKASGSGTGFSAGAAAGTTSDAIGGIYDLRPRFRWSMEW